MVMNSMVVEITITEILHRHIPLVEHVEVLGYAQVVMEVEENGVILDIILEVDQELGYHVHRVMEVRDVSIVMEQEDIRLSFFKTYQIATFALTKVAIFYGNPHQSSAGSHQAGNII